MITVEHVSKSYDKTGAFWGGKKTPAVKKVSFSLQWGECVGLIGESGSGKSTLGRMILGLEQPDHGQIKIDGMPIRSWIRRNRGKLSVVFQDYTSSVNPYFTIGEIIAEPLVALRRKEQLESTVRALLNRVALSAKLLNRYPHELSGGQLQRVCIARAISTNPAFMVLDEAISSLDVSIQAQILQLLDELRVELDMTYLFIAHDLQAVARLCSRVLFMYQGEIVEDLPTIHLHQSQQTYAQLLLNSVIYFDQQATEARA